MAWEGAGEASARLRAIALRDACAALILTLLVAGIPILAAAGTLSVSAINRTKCSTKTGGNSAFGSAVDYTVCRGNAGFGNGVLYNDVVATAGGAGSVATLDIDGGLLSDAAGSGKRVHLRQHMSFDITLDVQVGAGQEWEVTFDQSVAGLLAILEEESTPSNGLAGFFSNEIDVILFGTGDYDFSATPSAQGGSVTVGTPFSGARSDVFSGIGPTLITGRISSTLETLSQCAGGTGFCVQGDESAVLYGLDDVGGGLAVTADDYATWGRSVAGDGYNGVFSLTLVPEPGTGLLLLAGLLGLRVAGGRGRSLRARVHDEPTLS